ncbi:Ribosome biogenesis protein enp2-like protein [Zancudomyces culisetae]|uniref:Ribosome biogenesis protein enp2-like protein n=1 Tax=Zancudomyces culisetae TaxID=1213189 RepID=A0A1R1PZI2_ZANCU|nr:Ribosome biogenesis protein enp2-like protein [Zancudomyces culisetae]|eukprot:OMH86373.1 Ribosome biogenesis protein enp2-like protein [Zancudomyces culisetae]
MVLQVSNPNNVKIYTVSGSNVSRKLPEWLARAKKKALKKDIDWQTRIELIQDFEFPEASNRIKITPDGQYCIATGVYKPQMRVFDFSQMSLKFERHTEAENVNFEILSEDWTKTVHLQNDRSIEFHSSGGLHYKTRIPKFGRDLAYHYPSCDLLVVGASKEVYRLNLERGQFLNPLLTSTKDGINVVSINPAHQLFAFGTDSGTVEFWDPRTRGRIGLLTPSGEQNFEGVGESGLEISAISFKNDGLGMALGTSTGKTMLFDLRQAHPLLAKDQGYGTPIKKIEWVEPNMANMGAAESSFILSADAKSIKIWGSGNGKSYAAMEPSSDINDVCVNKNTGLIFVAGEGVEMHTYFVPSLGPPPKWASFLENLTEELEESKQVNVYEDFKFVTKKDLEALGVDHLIGSSNILKPYMHGFFMDLKLYEQAKAIANPFAYEEYKAQKVREKIEKQRSDRIRADPSLPKVNKNLALRLIEQSARGADSDDKNAPTRPSRSEKTAKARAERASGLLKDSRFTGLFDNPEFEVDEESNEYRLLKPTVSGNAASKNLKRASVVDDDDSSDDDNYY